MISTRLSGILEKTSLTLLRVAHFYSGKFGGSGLECQNVADMEACF